MSEHSEAGDEMMRDDVGDTSSNEITSIWNIIESHGVKLPDYIMKLLFITGYENLHCLMKLVDVNLIQELEKYATDNLVASDLGLSDAEEKYFFNHRSKVFTVLPGHKHLIVTAAQVAVKIFQEAAESAKEAEENAKLNAFHFLEYSTGRINTRPPVIRPEPMEPMTIEEEQASLSHYIKTWISRKVLFGQMDPFELDVDYKIHIFQPNINVLQGNRYCNVYTFVCLRCNTTIKAFKRPNGANWNAANVCRHIVDVHSNLILPQSRKRSKSQKSPPTGQAAMGSVPLVPIPLVAGPQQLPPNSIASASIPQLSIPQISAPQMSAGQMSAASVVGPMLDN